jgi:hypothetical protein
LINDGDEEVVEMTMKRRRDKKFEFITTSNKGRAMASHLAVGRGERVGGMAGKW